MARKRSLLHITLQPILKRVFWWKYHQKIIAILLSLLTLTLSITIPAKEKATATENTLNPTLPLTSQASNALELEKLGNSYYEAGHFSEAVQVWQEAADAYGVKNEEGKNRNIINKAQALKSLGLYPEACNQITKIITSKFTCDQLIRNNKNFKDIKATHNTFTDSLPVEPSINKINSLRILGDILQRFDELELSDTVLKLSLEASKYYPEYQSAIFISLGNLERTRANKDRDLDYQKFISDIFSDKNFNSAGYILKLYKYANNYYNLAKEKAPLLTQIQAELNQLNLLVENKQWWVEHILKIQDKIENDYLEKSQKKLDEIITDKLIKIELILDKLPQNREATYAYINFSSSLINLNLINIKSDINKEYFPSQKIAKFLSTAIQRATNLKDKQAEVFARGSLARLYEQQVSRTENLTQQDNINLNIAKKLTEQALFLSNEINADGRQMRYRHRHLLGRILKAQGDIKGALLSYAEAWNILQSLRADLVTNVDNQFSFRQNVEPIYREFIDLLLQAYRDKNRDKKGFDKLVLIKMEDETSKNLLDIARLVMESLQLAELDNFFQEPCSPPIDKPLEIDKIDQNNKINPDVAVIYPIILKNRLEIIVSRSGKTTSYYSVVEEDTVKKYLEDFARIIYNKTALIEDSSWQIYTGGGTNRDKEFEDNEDKIKKHSQLIYDWLIGRLEDNNQLVPNENTDLTLVFVLDRAFQKIPISALYDKISGKYLIQKYKIVLNLGRKLIAPKPISRKNIKILAAGTSEGQGIINYPPFEGLEGVKDELDNIEKLEVDKTVLRDENFNKNNLQTQIKTSPTIVHLATHGVFSSNREQTFIVTGDNKNNNDDKIIKVDDLQNLLNPDGVRRKNIELLVLSACQTASGDERAALGMAGVVIRSQANSAIASLWSISDKATVDLMNEFYKNLITNNTNKQSRADALRNAQLHLLGDTKYKHPFYWAPFVLVGNWL
jgi:CHAT domain-containing protein